MRAPKDETLRQDISALQVDLSEYADQQDWCGAFEDHMQEVGLASVRQEDTDWWGRARVTVDLSTFGEQVYDMLTGERRTQVHWPFHTHTKRAVVDGTAVVEVDVSGTIPVPHGDCACRIAADDDSRWRDQLPEWVGDATAELIPGDGGCDNCS